MLENNCVFRYFFDRISEQNLYKNTIMSPVTLSDSAFSPLYRIGAVSNLCGVPVATLRVWERRYGVVEPPKTEGGQRLYSESDVLKLTLLKNLTQQGHAISSIGNLAVSQLQAMLNEHRAARSMQVDAPTGSNQVFSKVGTRLFDKNKNTVMTFKEAGFGMTVTGYKAGIYSIVYGDTFYNGLPAYVNASDVIVLENVMTDNKYSEIYI